MPMPADTRGLPVQKASLLIKICGLNTPQAVEAAVAAGADLLGFVFFPKSPRYVVHREAAELTALARRLAPGAGIVALTVDASDADLEAIIGAIAPDWLQLHGGETPERVAAVRERFKGGVMKALGVGSAGDVARAHRFAEVADSLLLDAKPAADAVLPGGNGIPFDHRLIAGERFGVPFLLSGGLHADNVADAIRLVRPQGVDVSSGVESAPGVKDAARIAAFVRAAREALDMVRQ
ncbi:phosphoribosylanthranilate isomerase [Pseudochelatococcus lubricantis]|uniref:N-(5'-phosphoribosyl)anthranilate isomerase n=1 Tax=Pseudochelatococcus lubricantis TaxID=1538102 RepID=A0ABX0V2D2_9HYPH|nr:phosphoribosylanthranilate isomerase [Pseudochelatococcus lubricantis]NIJ59372.1 phosphoribosylanthranilate isomerase [Pseudochelatococcus lubricantis]